MEPEELPRDFDWEHYLALNDDLRKAGIRSERDAVRHWLSAGRREARVYGLDEALFPKDFSCETYLKLNEDLRRAKFRSEYEIRKHWLLHGRFENRRYRMETDSFHDRFPSSDCGVNLVGFMGGEFGLGEYAREIYRALKRKIPFSLFPVSTLLQSERDGTISPEADELSLAYPINLLSLDMATAQRILDAQPEFFQHKINIGVWLWELEDIPEAHAELCARVDEIWTGSEYCRKAFEKITDTRVVKINVPLEIDEASISDFFLNYCDDRSISERTFKVVCLFDYFSDVLRKNPLGAIEAFEKSFSSDDNAVLVLKSINGSKLPTIRDFIEARIRKSPLADRIFIVDECLRKADSLSFLRHSDCLLSLHRSEGQGRHLMEAMLLAKPVIATRYSGNLDFMSDANSWLVDYAEVPVADAVKVFKGLESSLAVGCANYYTEQHYLRGFYVQHGGECVWAEPDLNQAADALRALYQDWLVSGPLRETLGHAGQQTIRRQYGAERCAAALQDRIESLFAARYELAGKGRIEPGSSRRTYSCFHIGVPKTGTTFLQKRLLQRHSQIHYIGHYNAAESRPLRPIAGRNEQIDCLLKELLFENHGRPDLALSRGIYDREILPFQSQGMLPVWSWEVMIDGPVEVRIKRANNLREIFGEARILITIRHPVSLVCSAYLMYLNRNNLSYLYRKEAPYLVGLDEWLDMNKFNTDTVPRSFLDYARNIEIYAQIFGRDSMKILLFEDLLADQDAYIRSVCEFMEIDVEEAFLLTRNVRQRSGWSEAQFQRLKDIKHSPVRSLVFRYASMRQRRKMLGFDAQSVRKDTSPKKRMDLSEAWVKWVEDLTRSGNRHLADKWGLDLEKHAYPL
jgi:glycosyltransferase involved in cell wall biosynthesis